MQQTITKSLKFLSLIIIPIIFYTKTHSFQLSYRQTSLSSISKGYNKTPQWLHQQQGVLSYGPFNINYQGQCSTINCKIMLLQSNYYPEKYQINFGYQLRFLSHTLAQRKPFFGLSIKWPNTIRNPQSAKTMWTPWLGIRINKPSQVTISDSESTIFLGQLDPNLHYISQDNLPYGSYNVNINYIDINGKQKSHTQFINSRSFPEKNSPNSLELDIGTPVSKPKKNTFGLPSISSQENLQLGLSYDSKTPQGRLHNYIGLLNQSIQLGLSHAFQRKFIIFAPEILWEKPTSQANKPYQSIALGYQLQGIIFNKIGYMQGAYTYPKEQKKETSSILHNQIYYQNCNNLFQATLHLSQQEQHNYWQAKFQKPLLTYLKYWKITSAFFLTSYANKKNNYNFHLDFKQKQNKKLHMSISPPQQTISSTFTLDKNIKTKISVKNNKTKNKKYKQISNTTQINTQVAKIYSKISNNIDLKKSNNWSLKIKSGLSIVQKNIIWHNLSSPWQSAQLLINPAHINRWFWWGDNKNIEQQGLKIKTQKAYKIQATTTNKDLTNTDISFSHDFLYPGNLVLHKNYI